MWYVYFLELNNGHIYVGSTDDLRRRVHSHRSGRVLSTKRLLPAKLKTYVAEQYSVTAATFPSCKAAQCGEGERCRSHRILPPGPKPRPPANDEPRLL